MLYPLQRAVQMPGEALAWVGDLLRVEARRSSEDNATLKRRARSRRRPRRRATRRSRDENAQARARCSTLQDALRGRRDGRRGALHRPRSVRAEALRRPAAARPGIEPGERGDRRDGVVGPGHARVSRHGRGDARHRQGPRGAGARSSAAACAACSTARAPGARRSCASWRRPPTSSVGDLLVTSGLDGTYPAGPRRRAGRRRSSATPARSSRGSTCMPLAGVDRSEHLLVLGAAGGAAGAAGGAGRGRDASEERPREGAARRMSGRRCRDGARRACASPSTPARPEEILRPAKPWFIVLTLALALLANLLPLTGVALALKPDFLALVLLYWCIQEPRYVGVGVAWTLGLADGRRRRDAVRPARARLCGARLRRRVFPPPRAALPAVAAGGAGRGAARRVRGARAARALRRRRAAAALDLRGAAARRRAAVAAAVGAAAVAAAPVALAARRYDACRSPPRSRQRRRG